MTPTNSSFNQRRAQILPEAFEFLFHEFTKKSSDTSKKYKGYRLIACDGSDLCISHNPDDVATYFKAKSKKGHNLLHLNTLYDLNNRTYIDAIIQSLKEKNECQAMCNMIDNYSGEKAIFIADRNYESYNVFAHVVENKMFYLIRVKDINSSGILKGISLPKTSEFDVCKNLTLTRKHTKETRINKEKYKNVAYNSKFDYLDSQTQHYYDLPMRILRFPISKNSYECIITNLSNEEFNTREIKELYSKRWGIETSYRELKYAIGLTKFHSKNREYIYQEIWARMILYNFCENITNSIILEKNKIKKHGYQLNYSYAIHICRYYLSLKEEKAPPNIEKLISRELLPIRPNRSAPRRVKAQSAMSFLYRVS